jgi:hypothetical protein
MACQVHRLDLATERVSLWREFSPADPTGIILCNTSLPSEDGRSYAYSYRRCLTDIVLAEACDDAPPVLVSGPAPVLPSLTGLTGIAPPRGP